MKAIAVDPRGPVSNLAAHELPDPAAPEGYDILVEVKACSVNPVDIKVRNGTYDDYPDYFEHAPSTPHILGFDGSGIITSLGPSASFLGFKPGDSIFYSPSPFRQGTNAAYHLVDARSVALKPPSLNHIQAASMPLTFLTAYEALVERMGILPNEKAGLLVINGAGGVGSMALQIARRILKLPVVIGTASRPETKEFVRKMGGTHVLNHREDLVEEVKKLGLPEEKDGGVPIKYVFITHSTAPYLKPAAAVCAPFGTVCSIVQTKEMGKMYGSEFMGKGLRFVWELVSTKGRYGGGGGGHGSLLKKLAGWVEEGTMECTLTQERRLNVKGLREAHELVEAGGVIGKVGVGVEVAGDGDLFA